MSSNLSRLMKPTIAAISRSQPSILPAASNSAIRLASSSTASPEEPKVGDEKNEASTKVDQNNSEEDDEGDEIDLNEETGEVGGPRGPEPTRYGDWERNGRCYDF